MKTASFWTAPTEGRISIARTCPPQFRGLPVYRPLNPGPWFKSCKSWEEYCERYAEVLAKLYPMVVVEDLASIVSPYEPVLCCWELPGKPCHRRLVAEWLREKLGWVVDEYVRNP